MSDRVVVVVAGGPPPDPQSVLAAPLGAHVIAADEGLEHALALGLHVATAVGDFDSVSPAALAEAEAAGVRIERHPEEKDATDLELALDRALSLDAPRVLVIAGDGGRLDHLLATLLLLGSPRYETIEIDAVVGAAHVHVVRGARDLAGEPGQLLSLLPLHGPAEGVRTDGLVYPLRGETLQPGTSRGVSNVFAESTAHVSVERGVLLAIKPGGGS